MGWRLCDAVVRPFDHEKVDLRRRKPNGFQGAQFVVDAPCSCSPLWCRAIGCRLTSSCDAVILLFGCKMLNLSRTVLLHLRTPRICAKTSFSWLFFTGFFISRHCE